VQRIFEPQTSFGYVVSHKGRLYGWDTRLYGPKKISENFYLLQVPNNGSVKVKVAIQALESPNTPRLAPDGGGCLSILIAWLETKGPVGRLAALLVRAIARLAGQPI
jgi:hypothetical protein